MLTRISGNICNQTIHPSTGDADMLAKDAEQVLAHIQRAEIELQYAAADIGSSGALVQYPEVEIAIMALSAAVEKLKAAAAHSDAPSDSATPKAN